MVTSYYLHMIASANNRPKTPALPATSFDIVGYYSNIRDIAPRSSGKSLCRVCLREGSIPIHGDRDIAEALTAIAHIKISEGKDYPKHLCGVCHKFLKGAIMFRKRANLTNKILKKSISINFESIKKAKENARIKKERNEKDNTTNLDDDPGIQNNDDSHSDTNNGLFQSKEKVSMTSYEKYSKNKRVTCEICNKTFAKKYYETHLTLHNPNHKNEHVCEMCGKSFRISGNLYSHQRIHHMPRKPDTISNFKFKCDQCPYRARQKDKLTAHMVIHSGVKSHMCTECPVKFFYICNLRKHMLIHKEPQVQCDSCEKMFHTNVLMRKHYEADHMGILKHVCNICGKAFGYRKQLSKHQRLVHKRERLDFKAVPAYIRVQMERGNTDVQHESPGTNPSMYLGPVL